MHPYYMPHLMGGCTKDRSKRSAIFDRATTRTFSRTPGVAGNRKTWSWSGWIKRGTLGILSGIFGASVGNATYYFWAYFDTDDRLKLGQFGAATTTQLSTTAVYRDPSAWMHILIVCDTTQATASERLRLYVNGQRITSFAAETYAAQNTDLVFNSNIPHRLGSGIDVDGGLYNAITCNMAEVHFTDGIVLQPANVGSTDWRSANWMHRHYSGDHGAQGYYLPFQGDAGDAPAVASEAAKDRAPITGAHVAANNWTANNFAASDFVKDTPTNHRSGQDYRGNYCTLNPVSPHGSGMTLSRGNLRFAAGGSATNYSSPGTIAMKTGRWYWEVDIITVGQAIIGIAKADTGFVGNSLAGTAPVYAYQNNGQVYPGGAAVAYGAALANADRVGVLYDASAGKLYFSKNNVWQGGADPVAGTGGITVPANTAGYFPYVESGSAGSPSTLQTNFGQLGFAYVIPANCKPLVVSALPRPEVTNPSRAFQQKTDSGANILAALAVQRSGWGADYVEIVKSLSAEGWRWRFGFDAGNHYDTSNAGAGRQAYPALPGGSYWGCSLRLGAAYGVAAGTVNHVNGMASVVPDGLSKARKVVILFPRAGGNMPVYHPDAAAGELLYLNSQNGDAPATDITAVDASGFSVGAGMATGTYDWLALAETSGLIDLLLYKANASADGPVGSGTVQAGLAIIKRRETNGFNWVTKSSLRNLGNPATSNLYINANSAEDNTASKAVDIGANFIKPRGIDGDVNNTGGEYCCILIGAAAFATGECAAQGLAR